MALSALDYIEIYQLHSRFNLSVDLGDVEGYVSTFTRSGWFEVQGLPEGAPAAGRNTGPDEIRPMVKKLMAGVAGHSRHFVSPTSMLIEGDENEVKSKGYLFELRAGVVPNTGVYLTGIFHDVIRKVDGKWLFASRSVRFDPQPEAGVPTDVLVVKFDELNRTA
ncbi:nuclear transport factor 2 family protein [Aminobacter sp. MSH1]|uniref:nuclear transport factor 2 family protein n=1 Tax=Aminobacter sp. MSH1 TaxID=374606 RepID=UPI000D3A5C4E|nr:nuclear transport factor 2 family protein [Aminobacter sp. MSH1]